jgi:hypothetical protein
VTGRQGGDALAAPSHVSPAASGTNVTVNGPNFGTVAGTINGSVSTTNIHIVRRIERKPVDVKPDIYFANATSFWIDNGDKTFDIGVIIRLSNLGSKSYLLRGIVADHMGGAIIGRGGWYLQQWQISYPEPVTSLDDRDLLANASRYYKLTVPVRFHMTPANGRLDNSGPPPVYKIQARWIIDLGEYTVHVQPEKFATAERIYSRDEWDRLSPLDPRLNELNLKYEAY